jgi:hypothetical protein
MIPYLFQADTAMIDGKMVKVSPEQARAIVEANEQILRDAHPEFYNPEFLGAQPPKAGEDY